MKNISSYILSLAAGAALLGGAVSCDDAPALPPMIVPVTDLVPNTSILDFKTAYWQSDRNYVAYPGNYNDEPGVHMVISGRVVSSNESGNIYNNIIIQDETAAITIAVRTSDMSTTPLFGQTICVDVTGLAVGGYNGLMQLGAEGTYNGAPSMTFMEGAVLDEHYGPTGLPDAAAIDTAAVSIAELNQLKATNAGLIEWQSRLVRLDNVSFEDQGQAYNNSSSTVSRYVKDSAGDRMILRISNYADFAREIIPGGTGSVTGILSYYGTDWQLLPIDLAGMQGFTPIEKPEEPSTPDQPDVPGGGDGTEAKPYTVAQVQGGVSGSDVWVSGYIVGYVPGMVFDEGVLGASGAVATNLLVADAADASAVTECIPVQLPAGDVRTALNLQNNPGNLGKGVLLRGSLEKYFQQNGLKSVTEYKLEGGSTPVEPDQPVQPLDGINENFDASSSIPAGWTQVQVAGNKSWYIPTFNGNNYAAMTGYKGTAPFDQYLVTPPVDVAKLADKTLSFDTEVNGYGSTTSVFEVYVMNAATPEAASIKTKLEPAIATAPASGYSDWKASGALDLSGFSGTIYIAFRYYATQDANYATWCVDNVIVK